MKRLSDRIPKKMYLTDSTVRLRSTELKERVKWCIANESIIGGEYETQAAVN